MQKLNLNCLVSILATVAIIVGTLHAEAAEKRVTVGNKNFTEQYVVGQLMKQLLEDRGFKVDLRSDLTSMALRAGMESGDIDICADYTGTNQGDDEDGVYWCGDVPEDTGSGSGW